MTWISVLGPRRRRRPGCWSNYRVAPVAHCGLIVFFTLASHGFPLHFLVCFFLIGVYDILWLSMYHTNHMYHIYHELSWIFLRSKYDFCNFKMVLLFTSHLRLPQPLGHLCYRTWSLMETVDAKLVWPHRAGNTGTLEVAGNTLEVTGSWTSRPRTKNREDAAEVDLVVPQPTSRLNGCDDWRKLASEIPTAWRNAAWIPWYQPSKVNYLNHPELLWTALHVWISTYFNAIQIFKRNLWISAHLKVFGFHWSDWSEVPHTESVPPKLVAEKMDTLPPMLTSNH